MKNFDFEEEDEMEARGVHSERANVNGRDLDEDDDLNPDKYDIVSPRSKYDRYDFGDGGDREFDEPNEDDAYFEQEAQMLKPQQQGEARDLHSPRGDLEEDEQEFEIEDDDFSLSATSNARQPLTRLPTIAPEDLEAMSEMVEFSAALEKEESAERFEYEQTQLLAERARELRDAKKRDKKERVKRAGKGSSSSNSNQSQASGDYQLQQEGVDSNGRSGLTSSTDLSRRRAKDATVRPSSRTRNKDSPLVSNWGSGNSSKTNSPYNSSGANFDDLEEKLAREAEVQISPRERTSPRGEPTVNSFIGGRRERGDRSETSSPFSSTDRHKGGESLERGSSRGDRERAQKSSTTRREFGITTPSSKDSREKDMTRHDSNPIARAQKTSSKHNRDSNKRVDKSERGSESEHSNSGREGREKKKTTVSSAKDRGEKESHKHSARPVEAICKECDMTFLIEHLTQLDNGRYVCGDCKQYASMFDAYGK
jgi:hypothetical protein